MKKFQYIMVWFLPVIVIGGLFIPALGYLVVAMMAALIVMSFFRGRYWCGHLCPRGAFLDIVLSKISIHRPLPKIFVTQGFRWAVFIIFMSFLIFRIMRTGGNIMAIGSVFVGMCILTTVISIILGIPTKHRGWCAICPMGTLQEKIGKISAKQKRKQA